MNKEIGERWVAALRSGEYEQYTTGGLKSPACDNRMCCLGVLADLYAKEHGVEWEKRQDTGKPFIMGEADFLPIEVRVWGDINYNPLITYGYYGEPQEHDIAFLNDSKVHFSTLANLIEEQLIEAEPTQSIKENK